VILIRLLLNSNHVNALNLQIRIQTALEEVAADKAEVIDKIKTIKIEVIDKIEIIEEVLQIIINIVNVVDLVEADINQVIEVADRIYISLIRGLYLIYSIIPN
jgi:serine phosphatase RsbU (regulator of sigma subunit)